MSGLRLRVAVIALAASATALLAVLLLVGPGLRERATRSLHDTLTAEARLMAHVVDEPLARGAGPDVLDPLVDAAARDVGARVTVIALNGRVLADSARSGEALLAMENHADRPEVRQALAGGDAASARRSATIHDALLYTAVPVRSGDRLVGVVRVARPLTDLAAQIRDLRNAVLAALAAAFLITVVSSALLSSSLLGPLRDLMTAARRIGGGDLGGRVPVRRRDEIGELARILDGAREQLQLRFAEAARDRGRLATILSCVADGVLAVDHRGDVVAVSGSLAELFPGLPLVGRPYVEVLRQRQLAETVEPVLAGAEPRAGSVLQLPGSGRVYELAAVPFPGQEGQAPGAVVTFRDVTVRQQLDAVRREFVANASHELRTPLTSIRGFVEALEDGALRDPEKGPRFLEKIRRHADRMSALLDDLLALSSLEAGERGPEWTAVDLRKLIEDVVSGFREAADAKGLSLHVSCAGELVVESDPERLHRILSNLVDNAVKYTQAGGHVSVRCAATAGGARLEVADDGPGIPKDHQSRVFERFYRIDKARSREAGGTGLGLSIVKHAAESIGARIALESAAGLGARFTVEIPSRTTGKALPPA